MHDAACVCRIHRPKRTSWDRRALCAIRSTCQALRELCRRETPPAIRPRNDFDKISKFCRFLSRLQRSSSGSRRGSTSCSPRSTRARPPWNAPATVSSTWRRALLKAAVTGELTRDWREANRPAETGTDLLARIRAEQNGPTQGSARRRRLTPLGPIDTDLLPALPEGWVWSSVGDLFEVTTGSTPSRAEPSYWSGDNSLASAAERSLFVEFNKTRECITSLALRGSSNRIHPPGTVLLAMIGEGKTRGQCAILDIAACNNQNSAAIRVGSTPIEPRYIYHVLQERYYRSRKESQGGNQPALNGQKVASMAIPLPSLEEINEIVSQLDYFLTLGEAAEHEYVEANTAQSKLRQSILKAAFEGRLVSQDPADEPASALVARAAQHSSREQSASAEGASGSGFRPPVIAEPGPIFGPAGRARG